MMRLLLCLTLLITPLAAKEAAKPSKKSAVLKKATTKPAQKKKKAVPQKKVAVQKVKAQKAAPKKKKQAKPVAEKIHQAAAALTPDETTKEKPPQNNLTQNDPAPESVPLYPKLAWHTAKDQHIGAFWHHGHLYVVSHAPIKLDNTQSINEDFFGPLQNIEDEQIQGFILRPQSPGFPNIEADGLNFLPFAPQKDADLELEPLDESTGAKAYMPAKLSSAPLTLTLPETDEKIYIAFAKPSTPTPLQTKTFVDFKILASEHCFAVLSKSPYFNITKASSGNGLIFQKDGNLFISEPDPGAGPNLRHVNLQNDDILNFGKWYPDKRPFNTILRELERPLALEKTPEKRMKAHLKLVQFYLFKSMGGEALALLAELKEKDADVADIKSYKALKAVAELLHTQKANALETFNDPKLDTLAHIGLWRAVAKARNKDFSDDVMQTLRNENGGFKVFYPLVLRRKVIELYTRHIIDAGKLEEAPAIIGGLERSSDNYTQEGYAKFLQARLLAAQNKYEESVAILKGLETSRSKQVSTLARLYNAELQTTLQTISLPNAIDELEKLHFAWRGDNLEWDIRKKLIDFYMLNGDNQNALKHMKKLISIFPKHKNAQKVGKEMENVFVKAVMEPPSKMSTFERVSFFGAFKELIPNTPEGLDAIKKTILDYLELDLLAPAMKLVKLGETMTQSPDTELKLRKAQLLLYQEKIAESLALLKSLIKIPNAQLRILKKQLEGRALYQMAHLENALHALEDDENDWTMLTLKGQILMELSRFEDALNLYRRFLKDNPLQEKHKNLDTVLLNYALAASKQDIDEDLMFIKDTYQKTITQSKQKDTFDVLLNTADKTPLEKLGAEIQDLDEAVNLLKQPL